MSNKSLILHLSLLKGVGPTPINRILETIPAENLSQIYDWSVSDIMRYCNIPQKIAENIFAGLSDAQILERESALLEKHQINIVTLLDTIYPELLRTIHLPPALLYYKGILPENSTPTIAFVGARAATGYGKKVVEAFVPPLVKQGWTIVSGGALGIDTYAHQAAVQEAGKTIVVFGSGLMNLYPYKNKSLFSSVLETGGALISSFPLQTEPLPHHFPARNRIISGLSKACVVVQAAQKSGSLITASFALEQGREVFAVPGCFDDPLSSGCHSLIKQGAHVATSAQEILQECGFASQDSDALPENLKQTTIPLPPQEPPSKDAHLLSLCKYPISLDELEQKTDRSLLELQTALFDLQLEGKVMQNFMGMWQAQ